jgi:triacylglycerol lipase
LRIRALAAAAVMSVLLATGIACTTDPPNGQASTRNPVVLVHGYVEGNIIWGPMINGLKAAGYRDGDITNFAYDTTGAAQASSASTAAGRLATAVDAALAHARANGNPNAAKVDIISHSYGSMVTRYCVAVGQCRGKVGHWVSLAGADGGTSIAVLPALIGQGSGVDMSPNSQTVNLLRQPQNIEAVRSQGVEILVQWTPNDGIIIPPQNSQWPTPANPDPCCNRQLPGTINHLNIFSNAEVISNTITFLGQ